MGVLLGTAAYMAPEQARGKAVDKGADIWAYGCVLYELLTGRVAFAGETITDSLAAIMTRDLDMDALPSGTPPAVRRLLARCLERDPKQRLRDIGEARIALDPVPLAAHYPPEYCRRRRQRRHLDFRYRTRHGPPPDLRERQGCVAVVDA